MSHTKSSRTECSPTVDETSVTGDHGGINAVADHHNVPFLLLNLYILDIYTSFHMYHISFCTVVRCGQHRLAYCREVPCPVCCYNCIGRC